MSQDPDAPFPDEPWEVQISELLGRLSMVEPPSGFIEQAIDHRPLFAGRSLVGLTVAAAVLFAGSFALGAFGQPRLVPELNQLTSGSALVEAGSSASVFRQPGRVELDQLPGGTRIDLAGREAWIDHERGVIVVATEVAVVTMVGVDPKEAEALLDDIDAGPGGVASVVNRLTAGLGFPDLS